MRTYSILADRHVYPQFQASRPSTVLRALANDDPNFLELNAVTTDATRGLFVLIHPGDLVFEPFGWGHDEEARAEKAKAATFWRHTGEGHIKELADARAQNCDIFVLHRSSSTTYCDASTGTLAAKLWSKHLCPLFKSANAAWGDDLDQAAAWICANADLPKRPFVRMAGAYSCPKHGCLTHVAKALLAARGHSDGFDVSPHSPPENGPGMAWRPNGPVWMGY